MEKKEQLEEIMSQRIVQVKSLETWWGIELRNFSYVIEDGDWIYFEILATKRLPLDFPFNIFAVVYDNQNKIVSKKVLTINKLRLDIFDIRSFGLETKSISDIERIEREYETLLRLIDEDTKVNEYLRIYDKNIKKILIYPSKRQVHQYWGSNTREYKTDRDIHLEKNFLNRIILDKEKEKSFGVEFRNMSFSNDGLYFEILTLSGNSLERPFFLRADVYDKSNNIILKKKQHFKDLDLINLEIAKLEIDGFIADKSDVIEKIMIYPSQK